MTTLAKFQGGLLLLFLAVSKHALLMRLIFDHERVEPPYPHDRGFERQLMKILAMVVARNTAGIPARSGNGIGNFPT